MIYGPHTGVALVALLMGLGCEGIGVLLALFGLASSSKIHTRNMAGASMLFSVIGGSALFPYVPLVALGALLTLGISGLLLLLRGGND